MVSGLAGPMRFVPAGPLPTRHLPCPKEYPRIGTPLHESSPPGCQMVDFRDDAAAPCSAVEEQPPCVDWVAVFDAVPGDVVDAASGHGSA